MRGEDRTLQNGKLVAPFKGGLNIIFIDFAAHVFFAVLLYGFVAISCRIIRIVCFVGRDVA